MLLAANFISALRENVLDKMDTHAISKNVPKNSQKNNSNHNQNQPNKLRNHKSKYPLLSRVVFNSEKDSIIQDVIFSSNNT